MSKITAAPFDANGNLLFYAHHSAIAEWRPIAPLVMSLSLVGYQRGRSAAYYVWRDREGHTYPMFFSEMYNTIQWVNIVKGVTAPVSWTIRKRGRNYGIGPMP